jgi:hypothetical protein
MSAEISLGWNNKKLAAGAAGAGAIVDRTARGMENALNKVQSLPTPAWIKNGLAAGAGVFAISAVKGLADEYDHLWDLSQRLNESPESIQRIGLQAKLTGTDVETAVKALQKLNLELRKGSDSEGSKALKGLGLDVADFLRLSPEAQLSTLAAAFQKAQASGDGFAEIFGLMGKKFNDLLPLLRSSKEQLKEIAEIPVISEEQLAQIAGANDQLDILGKLTKDIGAATMSGLLTDAKALIGALADGGREVGGIYPAFIKYREALLNVATETAKTNEATRQTQRDADALAAEYDQLAAECEAYEKSQAKANEETRKAGEEAAKADEALGKLKATLKGEQDRSLDLKLNDLEKLGIAEARLKEINQQLAAVRGQKGGEALTVQLDTERERTLQTITQLEDAIAKAEADQLVKSQQLTAEQTKRQNEQSRSLELFDLELAILEAQGRGQDKKAEKLQREHDLIETTARLVEELGLGYDEAAKKAGQLIDAQDSADSRKDGKPGGRNTIHGYSQDQGNANDARAKAQENIDTQRQRYDESIGKHFGTFSTNDAATRDRFTSEFGGKNTPDPSSVRTAPIGARAPAGETAAKDTGIGELVSEWREFASKTTEVFERALQ